MKIIIIILFVKNITRFSSIRSKRKMNEIQIIVHIPAVLFNLKIEGKNYDEINRWGSVVSLLIIASLL